METVDKLNLCTICWKLKNEIEMEWKVMNNSEGRRENEASGKSGKMRECKFIYDEFWEENE